MKRLTTDNPQNNTDAARNLFFIKDGEAWVRRGSPEPDYPDISLLSLMRRILAAHGIHLDELDDQGLSDELFDMLFYGPETTEGLIALLYSAGWAFAELRARLKRYEDLEEAGRLVTLPCKVGNTLYEVDLPQYGVIECQVRTVLVSNAPFAGAKNGEVKTGVSVIVEVVAGHGKGSTYAFELADFGKSVFFTRGAAEAAIVKKMKEAGKA